jgi:hypothetical protein
MFELGNFQERFPMCFPCWRGGEAGAGLLKRLGTAKAIQARATANWIGMIELEIT